MTQINPLVGSIIQTPLAQRQQAAERATLARQSQDMKKNSGLHGSDRFEHQVESNEAVTPSHDEQKRRRDRKPPAKQTPDDETAGQDVSADALPRLDLTA